MADPIEIISTVISISKQIYSAAQSIKGAPDEQKAVENELTRLHVVLEYLVQILGSRVGDEQPERQTKAIQGLCDEARKLIDLANGTLGDGKTRGYKLRKVEWPRWLLKKSNREDLVKQLQKLNAAIDTFFSYDGHQELGRFRAEVDGGLQIVTQQIDAQTNTMHDIRHDIQESHGGMADMLRDMSCRLDQQDRRGEDMYYLLVRYIMRSAGRNQSHELNQQYDQVTTTETITAGLQRLSPTTVAPDSPCTHTTVRCDTSPPSTITQDMGSCRGSYSNDRCPPSCRCRCHRPPISAIPAWLQFIFGRALIHHDWLSAIASARTACNDRECRRHRSNLLQIKYCCPTWFAQINAEIRTERVPIHFVIQTPKIVQSLAWIDHATLDEVRQKLWSRELTVNDVDLNGCSVVHRMTFRLILHRSDAALSILAILTEHSAPADWEYGGLTPTEHALRLLHMFSRFHGTREAAFSALKHWLGPHLPQDIEEAYEGLATKRHWTTLHRLITRPSSSAVTFIPLELISQVNIKDSSGWTPLFYAALVPPEAIHALLVVGANPRTDAPVLNNAAWAGASTAISMLVRAGAYINAFDAKKHTALHCAADPRLSNFWDGFAVALQLVRHAGHLLDWDARDNGGRTPYEFAQIEVRENPENEKSKHILKLYQTCRLPEGAQYIPTPVIVDVEDGSARDDGTNLPSTSLIRAGLRGDVDAISDLIRRDGMVNERDDDGLTLLHLVALGRVPNGYRVALELVRHGGWGVDWDALVAASEWETEDENKDGNEDDNGDESESQEHCTGSEDDSGKEGKDDKKVTGTALEIAQARLDEAELTEEEREELENIRDLLQDRRLPHGEKYLWPCMDPDFYKPKPQPMPRMPGAWDDE